MENIIQIAKKLNMSEEDIECFGKYKAKISRECIDRLKGNKKKHYVFEVLFLWFSLVMWTRFL